MNRNRPTPAARTVIARASFRCECKLFERARTPPSAPYRARTSLAARSPGSHTVATQHASRGLPSPLTAGLALMAEQAGPDVNRSSGGKREQDQRDQLFEAGLAGRLEP